MKGQSWNGDAVRSVLSFGFKLTWIIPHARVRHVGGIDWPKLRNQGFKFVVFDKDNTLTAPFHPLITLPHVQARYSYYIV